MPRRPDSQPVRVPTGGPHGQSKQLETAQKAIPLPARETGGGTGGSPAPSPAPTPAVFDPTGRPREPITAGAPAGPGHDGLGILPDTEDDLLRAVAMMFPNTQIRRLLEYAAAKHQ